MDTRVFYYTITPNGRHVLSEAQRTIGELVHEVLEGQGPTTLPGPADIEETQEVGP